MKRLLIYYGWPSAVPLEVYARYDVVVLGAGLEEPDHPEHEKARAIIEWLPRVAFYGYLDLGMTTSALPPAELHRRTGRWAELGATGLLLDDYGDDYGVTRQRRAVAVANAHAVGLLVCANAWRPEQATGLGRRDALLLESWPLERGGPESSRRQRAKLARWMSRQCGCEVWSVGTGEPYARLLQRSWYAALRRGHAAAGYARPDYQSWYLPEWLG